MRILTEITVATCPAELPAWVAKAIGPMFLRRYIPSPVPPAQRGFKDGTWKGVLAWACLDGRVVGWAIRATPPGKERAEVMVFVTSKLRRRGIGDALLDAVRRANPDSKVTYYPHDPASSAFYTYRENKLCGRELPHLSNKTALLAEHAGRAQSKPVTR